MYFLPRAPYNAIARDGHIEVEDSEERSRRQNKSRDMEDGKLFNERMKDKITATGNDLHFSTQAIYFAR